MSEAEIRPKKWDSVREMHEWHRERGERVVEYQEVTTIDGQPMYTPILAEPREPSSG